MVLKLVNCNKCNIKCTPAYHLKVSSQSLCYVCRECALIIMKEYYDRRPDEIEETD